MKIIIVPFLVILMGSNVCFSKDQTLVIHQIRGGLDYRSEVEVKESNIDTKFQLQGFNHNWSCEAWPEKDKNAIVLTCYQLEEGKLSAWKAQTCIQCDSEDSFFIDAVTIKCQGSKPVKFWGK